MGVFSTGYGPRFTSGLELKCSPMIHTNHSSVMRVSSRNSCTTFYLQEVDDGVVTNTAQIEAWKQKDIDARTYLYSTINPNQQCSLHGLYTSHSMWTRIQTEYAQAAADNVHLVTAKFFDYKYQPNHSIMSHIATIEQMAAHLKELNAPISDIQVMSKILLTLPPSYRHFLAAWDNVPTARKTIKLLTSRLIKEEMRTKQYNGGASDPADLAFFAKQTQAGTSTAQPALSAQHYKSRGKNRGNKGGHKGDKPSYQSGVVCDYCHKHGHSGAICRKRLRHEKEKESIRNKKTETSYLSAICFSARRSFDWYADSGATRHMTDQRSIMSNFTPVEAGEWTVTGIGGTQLTAHGEGDINIISTVNGVKHNGNFHHFSPFFNPFIKPFFL